MYVYMWVYVHVYMHMCVLMYVHIRGSMYVSVSVHICVLMCMCVSACVCMYMWVCVCAYVCACVCVSECECMSHAHDYPQSQNWLSDPSKLQSTGGYEPDDKGPAEGPQRLLTAAPSFHLLTFPFKASSLIVQMCGAQCVIFMCTVCNGQVRESNKSPPYNPFQNSFSKHFFKNYFACVLKYMYVWVCAHGYGSWTLMSGVFLNCPIAFKMVNSFFQRVIYLSSPSCLRFFETGSLAALGAL